MSRATMISLAIVAGVVAVAFYLTTRGRAAGAMLGGELSGGGGMPEGAAYLQAGGEAVGSVLGGVSNLIGSLYGGGIAGAAGGASTGAKGSK